MKSELKRLISYISCCLINNKKYTKIFSYKDNKFYFYSFNSSNVYDYDRSSFSSISKLTNNNYNIYDMKIGNFITLKLQGNNFSGYDYNTSSFFNGNVQGSIVTFYSMLDSQYIRFSLA